MKYFEAEKVIEALAEQEMYEARLEWPDASDDLEDWKEAVIDTLEDVPSIEVVRCKDCRHYESDDLCGNAGCCKSTGLIVVHDWYCADGERREE